MVSSSATGTGQSVSVVVALYNGRSYVRGALETVVAQSVVPHELIVVDDGSTDGSADVVAALEAPFPIEVVRQVNLGQSAARNVGVRMATGDFIAFLDQDDEWRSGHLERLLKAVSKRADIGWAYSDFDEMDTRGRTVTHGFIREHGLVHPKHTLAACLSADVMALPSASLMRRSALLSVGGFDEALSGYEDDELFLRMFRAGWRHAFVRKSLTRFRVHADGTSSSSSSTQRFLDSRMTYLDRLIDSVADDDRLNRYWVRDLVLPRFFVTTVGDYSWALSRSDWEQSARAAAAAERLASMMPRRLKRRIGVRLMRYPRLCRRLLRMVDALPAPMRRWVSPALRLRPRPRRADRPVLPAPRLEGEAVTDVRQGAVGDAL